MNDRGTYDGVPTRLKVADVLVNYGKDVSFTRSGLIKSPFREERTPSFHLENTFEIVVPSGTSGFAWQGIRVFLTERTVRERQRSCRGRTRIGLASGKVFQVRGTP